MSELAIALNNLENVLCLGIAGNFAGHLEQAGETPDFINVSTTEAKAPKGLFPYYIPNNSGFIGRFPLSATEITYPKNLDDSAYLQAEPEVCVLFNVSYQNEQVISLEPKAFAVFNDCSIRQSSTKKISEKKNWGTATKGISKTFIPLTGFGPGCELDSINIASFLKRDGQIYAYGKDSSVLTYSYFHTQLKDWMIRQLNQQTDLGPLENMSQIIKDANNPPQIMISLGATSYTKLGETAFLKLGDEIFFCAYNTSKNNADDVYKYLFNHPERLSGSSILHQKIV